MEKGTRRRYLYKYSCTADLSAPNSIYCPRSGHGKENHALTQGMDASPRGRGHRGHTAEGRGLQRKANPTSPFPAPLPSTLRPTLPQQHFRFAKPITRKGRRDFHRLRIIEQILKRRPARACSKSVAATHTSPIILFFGNSPPHLYFHSRTALLTFHDKGNNNG